MKATLEFDIDEYYKRVLPRDLFNEAKLLKCMGRLCLLIHDDMIPVKMEKIEDFNCSWTIGLCDDGYLIIKDLEIYVKGKRIYFRTVVNSKEGWPLFAHDPATCCEYRVFNERGVWDREFLEFVHGL